jgi:hypothetical protein
MDPYAVFIGDPEPYRAIKLPLGRLEFVNPTVWHCELSQAQTTAA